MSTELWKAAFSVALDESHNVHEAFLAADRCVEELGNEKPKSVLRKDNKETVLNTIRRNSTSGLSPLTKIRPQLESQGIGRAEQDKLFIELWRAGKITAAPDDGRFGLSGAQMGSALSYGGETFHYLIPKSLKKWKAREKYWWIGKGQHEFSSTQIDIPSDLASVIRSKTTEVIPELELAEDGYEDKPHVTVLFGLHTNDAKEVENALRENLEGLISCKFSLGKVSIFDSRETGKDYDVVKVDVEDISNLKELHYVLANSLPHTDTHPEYKPHLTLAYVKAGLGEKYVGIDLFDGLQLDIDTLTFSNKDRKKFAINLGNVGRMVPKSLRNASTDQNGKSIGKRYWNAVQAKPSVAKGVQKEQGTCKPGERSDLTGCTPASGTTAIASQGLSKKTFAKAKQIVDKFKADLDKVTDKPVLRQVKTCLNAVRAVNKKVYETYSARYGKKAALAIMASGQALAVGGNYFAGIPTIPAASALLASIPGAVIAETILQAEKAMTWMEGGKKIQDVVTKENNNNEVELSNEEIQRLAKELVATIAKAFTDWMKENVKASPKNTLPLENK